MPIELTENDTTSPPPRAWKTKALGAGAVVLLLGLTGYAVAVNRGTSSRSVEALKCKQMPTITPEFEVNHLANSSIFTTDEYVKHSIDLLSKAIQIPTVVYDDMELDPAKDKRFDVFSELHGFLFDKFPRSAEYVEKVNHYGLLYTIPGTDSAAKPVVMMAHQDVVPVAPESADQWEYDPFAGFFDGEWIHGRGASDTKNSLIGVLEAVEALLSQHWRPRKTLVLSFGFDEEIQGARGAKHLADVLLDKYGPNGVEVIHDEGGAVSEQFGAYFGFPSVAEKGRINYKATLNTPGGHSSMPPDHTGIGILSDLIVSLESDPLEPSLLPDADIDQDVVKAQFSCLGRFAPGLPDDLKSVYTGLSSPFYSNMLVDFLASNITTRVLVETTQAIDVIHGGVKVNALPESTIFEANYRIRPGSSLKEERDRFLLHAANTAKEHNLELYLSDPHFGEDRKSIVQPSQPAGGELHVEVTDSTDIAPVSPFFNSTIWDILGGTTKHVFQEVATGFDDLPVFMAPNLLVGNTDTVHYWDLTPNIYRYTASLVQDMQNIHTVNEKLRFRSHISTLIWYYEYLVNINA